MKKSARVLSDDGNSALGLYQTEEGDIVIRIYGDGEMRISNSGTKRQAALMSAISYVIDLANGEEPFIFDSILTEEQKKLRYDLEYGCPAQSCGACDYGSPEGRDGECQMTQRAAKPIDTLVAAIATSLDNTDKDT